MAEVRPVTASANGILAGLKRTTQWQSGTLTYAIAGPDDSARMTAVYQGLTNQTPSSDYDPIDANDPVEAEYIRSIVNAFESFSRVTNLNFTQVTDVTTADLVIAGGFDRIVANAYAFMEGPGDRVKTGETDDYQVHLFTRTNDAELERVPEIGAASFNSFLMLHELGHGLGLSHPHDNDKGTTAWSSARPTSTDSALDNERYTVMSYEVGGVNTQTILAPPSGSYGHSASIGTLDIAALQEVHGFRAAHTSDTNYILTDAGTVNLDTDGADGTVAIGRAYYAIWDTGGNDRITYAGSSNAYINLNDATLFHAGLSGTNGTPGYGAFMAQVLYTATGAARFTGQFADQPGGGASNAQEEFRSESGGGFISTLGLADGSARIGGYSIARGVVIENAIAGGGDDILIGNEANNTLQGNNGSDLLAGWSGNDFLSGDGGNDELIGGIGNDDLRGGGGDDIAYYTGTMAQYSITATGVDGQVRITHNGGGADGTDTLLFVEQARFLDGTVDLTAIGGSGPGFGSGPVVDGGSVFLPANGWGATDRYPRMVADLDNDGADDLLGYGNNSVFTALNNGDGTFAPLRAVLNQFGVASGWANADAYARTVGDVNGDGFDDVIGFGASGVGVALGDGAGGFGAPAVATDQFGASTGWFSDDRYPRQVADVDGDGRADIVGFGQAGTYVALGQADGTFAAPMVGTAQYGRNTGWTTQDRYPRQLADVNGDGRADIVGFGEAGVYVSLGTAGGAFAAPVAASTAFGGGSGWTSDDRYPRLLADVNGDGRADIVGIGATRSYVALGQADGTFGALATAFGGSDIRTESGFISQSETPLFTGDFNGDGRDDLGAFTASGPLISPTAAFTPEVASAFGVEDDDAPTLYTDTLF